MLERLEKHMVNPLLFVIPGIAIAVLTWGFAHGQTLDELEKQVNQTVPY